MWVINPSGLPGSGKVAAVISSAFGSFSDASRKGKRVEWDNNAVLKKREKMSKVQLSTKGKWRTGLFLLCCSCVFPHRAWSAKALRASSHPFRSHYISLSVLKIGTQWLPVEFHLNSTWEHKRLITAITKALFLPHRVIGPARRHKGPALQRARACHRLQNGPASTPDYVSSPCNADLQDQTSISRGHVQRQSNRAVIISV